MIIKIKDERDSLWQWDTGRKVVVEEPCDIVHFSNLKYGTAVPVAVENGEAFIPDELLQIGGILFCYAFVGEVENGYTMHEEQFEIERKPKPNDYLFTPTEYLSLLDLDKRVTSLEEKEETSGFSPVVEVFPLANGHRVQVTDVNGVQSFDVLNGEKGDKGEKGADGTSVTHSWNGTVLSVTSASGTSSSDLKGEQGGVLEPFYIDCTINQNGGVFSAVVTSETPTQEEVDTAFAQKRPIYLRWEAAGFYVALIARTPDGSGGFVYSFVLIVGDTTSTMQFMKGGFYNTSFIAQERIAVVSSESEVQEGKITIVV